MDGKHKQSTTICPDDSCDSKTRECAARQYFEEVAKYCMSCTSSFRLFELELLRQLFVLGCLLTRLFLAVRHERLDQTPPNGFRLGNPAAPRTLKTVFGPVRYVRTQMKRLGKGNGFFPLDAALGLTQDGFSPWVIQFVTRLATRMSFASCQIICKSMLGWSPSTETIEEFVLGLGRLAEQFAQKQAGPENDGEVLVIEVDGKCPPTAREEELAKRRGRRAKHPKSCSCKCQRHRGQAKRRRRGSKKRRKKGDKSKNGKEAVVIVIYTLKRGEDGRLHGPINKKVWASFGGRQRAAVWARDEATKRGFGPETTKTVQIVLDGAGGLRSNMSALFPKAILTIDVCHVVEKLWCLGCMFEQEGSEELKDRVEAWKELLYSGRVEDLVAKLRKLLNLIPQSGPGTHGKRKGLEGVIGYIEPRIEMMKYKEWRKADLVIASGQVEGAVRHLVGERMDCAGMRWIVGRAQAVLQLRCIELNGDWHQFITWSNEYYGGRLVEYKPVQIRTNQPLDLNLVLAV